MASVPPVVCVLAIQDFTHKTDFLLSIMRSTRNFTWSSIVIFLIFKIIVCFKYVITCIVHNNKILAMKYFLESVTSEQKPRADFITFSRLHLQVLLPLYFI